jgi:malonate transporter and related proteins
MTSLIETTVFVFGLVALGYVTGITGLLSTKVGDALTQYAITLAVPSLLFRTIAEADFAGKDLLSLWGSYFSGVAIVWIIGQLATTYILGRDRRASIVGGVAGCFSNSVLIGIPLVLDIYGPEGFEILSMIVMVHLPILLAASIVVFAWVDLMEGGPSKSAGAVVQEFFRNLFRNPIVVGVFAGILWNVSGLSMPSIGQRFVDTLASTAGPVALVAMGLGLGKFGISGNIRPAMLLTAIKLVVMPTVVLGIVLLVGLPPLVATIAVLTAALPTGVNPYIIAMQFGTGQGLASNTMTLTTAVSAITILGWLWVLGLIFG